MEVKPGYKQTEVGVIPEDWRISSLQKLCDRPITYGIVQCGPHLRGGIPYIRVSDMDAPELDVDKMLRVSPEIAAKFQRSTVQEGDLVYALRGRLGEVRKVPSEVAGANLTQGTARISPKGAIAGDYLLWAMRSPRLIKQAETQAKGTTFREITLTDLRELRVPEPTTKAEQLAIAAALSDVDALLGGLDRLLAKKSDLKQAAMQQLLTGQTRLPGFHGEWEVRALGDLGSTFGGLTGKTKADFGQGAGKYVTFMNVMSNVVIDCEIFERVRVVPAESQNQVMKGDLLFNGSSETPEEVAMCAVLTTDVPNLFLNSFCFGFRFRDGAEVDGLFMAYYLRCREGRELMKSLAQGSTRYNLSKAALLRTPLRMPSRSEQTSIAAALSDMDTELAALEARRKKTLDLKHAMMQELLTGKTRLVPAGAARA